MNSQAMTEVSAAQKVARFLYKSEKPVRKVLCLWIAIPIAVVMLLSRLLFPGNDGLGYLIVGSNLFS